MFEKNQIIETFIQDMNDSGEGIGKIDGYTLFIKDTVTGDKVRAVITRLKKNYGYARALEILIPSPDRVEPVCSEHKRCGGCTLQTMSYEAQLKFKENRVRESLIRIGGFKPELIKEITEPVLGMENPLRYRNKEQFPVGYDNSRNIISGLYISRTHEIISNTDCYLGPSENRKIVEIILDHMRKYNIEPFDERSGKGLVRHIIIRKGFNTGDIMVCIVIDPTALEEKKEKGKKSVKRGKGSAHIPGQAKLIEDLVRVEGVKSIIININTMKNNVIIGDESVTIWGSDVIRDRLMGLSFEISPEAFYQVNPVQTEILYKNVIDLASFKGDETVYDICCGIGTIALSVAGYVKKVTGVEIVEKAIENAKRNAAINNIKDAEFICAPAEVYLYSNKDKIKADLIIMDPPRKGMEKKSLEAIVSVMPEKIVYVSCDPTTLARDLKYLCENGYELKKVRPVDMFPMTVHVETVCLLSNRKPDARVKIDVDLEDYYRIKDEQKKNKASE